MERKITNSTQLIHAWANQIIPEKTLARCKTGLKKTGEYSADNTSLFYNNVLIGKHFIINKKRITLVKSFINIGSFGNGWSTHSVLRSVDGIKAGVTRIYDLDVPLKDIKSEENIHSLEHWLYEEILGLPSLQQFCDSCATILSFTHNNRRSRFPYEQTSFSSNDDNIYGIISTLKLKPILRKYFKLRKIKYATVKGTSYTYSSWKSYVDETHEFKIPIGKLITFYDKPLFVSDVLSQEMVDRYNIKKFYLSFRGDTLEGINIKSLDVATRVYNDKELYDKIIKAKAQHLKEIQDKEEKKLLQRKIDNFKSNLENLDKWKSNTIREGIYNSITASTRLYDLSYHSIRLLNNEVQTSFGVSVSINNAKWLYAYFVKEFITNKPDMPFYPSRETKISNFIVKCIDLYSILQLQGDEVITVSVPTLKIGCHNIPIFEVEDFIQRYNLDW